MAGDITFFLQDMSGGGAERVAMLLANGLVEAGAPVSMILVRNQGPFLEKLDPRIEIETMRTKRTALSPFALAPILKRRKPAILLSHMTHANVAALLGARLARMAHRTIVVEHNQFDRNYALLKSKAVKFAYKSVPRVYPWAGAVVSVADGVKTTLERMTGLKHPRSRVIDNPIVEPGLAKMAQSAPEHVWLRERGGAPTLVMVGSLTEQKDYATFLDALAELHKQDKKYRAVIHGEGPLRGELETQRHKLGLDEHVDFAGFTKNPFAAMRASAAFVLSSRWEGLPTVVVEALASGANVVSTDCPSGPSYILQDGEYGRLTAVGDPKALAEAIAETVASPAKAEIGKARAEEFSVNRAVNAYGALFREVVNADDRQRSIAS